MLIPIKKTNDFLCFITKLRQFFIGDESMALPCSKFINCITSLYVIKHFSQFVIFFIQNLPNLQIIFVAFISFLFYDRLKFLENSLARNIEQFIFH